MYITNNQLANQLAKADVDAVISHLNTILGLITRNGKSIKRESILTLLEKKNKELVALIRLLRDSNKLKTDSVKELIRMIKAENKFTMSFTIAAESKGKDLAKKLAKDYSADTHSSDFDKTGVRVEGEGMYYQRSLEGDLKKLLGKTN